MQEEILDDEDEKIFLASKSLATKNTLRSEMAQEIISRQPGFLERWSLLIFLIILLLVFGCTWFVHYPDIITSRAILTAENNPKEIQVRQDGRLVKLFVNNNQTVKENDTIGWIKSAGDHDQVNELAKQIDQSIYALNNNVPNKIFLIFNNNLNKLGELQQDYDQFLFAEDAFNNYILSGVNLRHAKSIHFIDHQQIIFRQQLLLLQTQVNEWYKKYVLLAPLDGIVSFNNNTIQENRYLRAGVTIGYVIPNNGSYYAETVLPQNNFGKLATGLHVQLRFDAYPYEEWGFLNGTISYISNVSTESGFLATIKLDNGLITNNQKQLAYKNGLRAQAIIITKDMRLLQRFYYGFVKSTSVDK